MSRRALLNQSLRPAAPPSATSPGVWRMTRSLLALYLGCTPRDQGRPR